MVKGAKIKKDGSGEREWSKPLGKERDFRRRKTREKRARSRLVEVNVGVSNQQKT